MPIDYGEGVQILRQMLKSVPRLPGVYLMRDKDQEVIYVGKAKDLRARLTSYARGQDDRAQIKFLLARLKAIEKIVVENEQQALVLERDLITKYKPRYNIMLKDDKSFLSVRIDPDADWPRLELVRRRREQDTALYFGPYASSNELRSVLEVIQKVIPLRSCNDTVFYNRARPCLEYQIKRCAGPCCLEVDRGQYRQWVKQAMAILEGKTSGLISTLSKSMEEAANQLRFEDAAEIRDRISAIESFNSGASLVSSRGEDRDVFAIYREEQLAALSVMTVRGGRLIDNVNYSFQGLLIGDQELLESALVQYYSHRDPPEEIILPSELSSQLFLAESLARRGAKMPELTVPQRGLKFRMLGLAELNAKEHFVAAFDSDSRYREMSKSLALMLKLSQIPRRIECLDISNFQASDTVGVIVSFFDGTSDKSRYRKYRLEREDGPDDFKSVYEVVSRRLSRGKVEQDLPDLLIIDGGPGQLAAAVRARQEAEVSLEIVGLAKARASRQRGGRFKSATEERIFTESSVAGDSDPVIFEQDKSLTHLISRIRDEAHRFAITFHRARRSKRVFASEISKVPGIGPERQRRLLRKFGSVRGILSASEEELAQFGRMPLSLAQELKRRLKGSDNTARNNLA